MENRIDEIIGTYLRLKDTYDPFTGEPLSKSKRIEEMYYIVQNRVYAINYSMEDRIFASKLITKILEEKDED